MKNKLAAAGIIMAVAATSLTSCGSDSAAETNKDGVQTIRVAISGGENPIFAPYLVAIGQGYFDDEKIKIEPHIYESGTLAFSAFAGGADDFCICGATQLLTANEQGRDFVGVFNQYIGGAVVFIGAKEYEETRGTDLTAYDGDKWGYTAEGSVSQVFMTQAAQAAGLDWDDQSHVAVGAVSAFIPALEQGQADIITMDATSAAQAIDLGLGYPAFNTNDPGTVEGIWGQQLGLPMVTTSDYAESNDDVVQRFVNALVRGLDDVKQNSDDAAAILQLMPESFQSANADLFESTWPLVADAFGQVDGTFSEQQIDDTVTFAVESGVLKNSEVPEGTFDNTYVEEAAR